MHKKIVICQDCEDKLDDEAIKVVGLQFNFNKIKRAYAKLLRERYGEKRFCEHFTIEFWKEKGFEDSWGDAAIRNYPHLTILRKITSRKNGCKTELILLAPYITRRPVMFWCDNYIISSY